MAKSLAVIQRQIAKLQQQADAIKAKEVVGVIERIRTAVAFYSLTSEDIFGSEATSKVLKTPGKGRGPRKTAAKKAPSVVKYRDEAGNSWSGHGKRPNWFKAAIESGKSPDDLLAKSEL